MRGYDSFEQNRYEEWGCSSGPRYSVDLVQTPEEGWVMAIGCNTLVDVERVAQSKTLGETLGVT